MIVSRQDTPYDPCTDPGQPFLTFRQAERAEPRVAEALALHEDGAAAGGAEQDPHCTDSGKACGERRAKDAHAGGAENARSVKLLRARAEADEKYVGQTAVVRQVRIMVGEDGGWERVDFVAEFPSGASKDVPLADAEVVDFWPRA